MTINKYEKARERFWAKYEKVNNELLEVSEKIKKEKDVLKLDNLGYRLARCKMVLAKLESLRDEKEFIKAVDEGVF
jgi:hypothetical protein